MKKRFLKTLILTTINLSVFMIIFLFGGNWIYNNISDKETAMKFFGLVMYITGSWLNEFKNTIN